MKKTLKRFFAFLTSAFLFAFSVIPFSSRTVSALSPFPIPDHRIIVGDIITDDIVHTFTETLFSNQNFIHSGFDPSKCFAFLFVDNNGNLRAWIL